MYYAAVAQTQAQQQTVAAANLAQQQQQLNLISQVKRICLLISHRYILLM